MPRTVRTLALLPVLVLAIGSAAAGSASADVGPTGLDDSDPIFVPIRWCALQGSPAVTNPGGVGEPDTDSVLWRRHERVTDNIFAPQALISFRSAFVSAAASSANFPVIPDPAPPPGGPGVQGDIVFGTELQDAVANCRTAWDGLETTLGVNIEGPVGLNLRHFVNADGSTSSLAGHGTFWVSFATTACGSHITSNNGDIAYASSIDNSFTLASDPHDALLAHELGHTLSLAHGNGLNDDGDGVFDACDGGFTGAQWDTSPPAESVTATPASLMTQGSTSEVITTLQRGTVLATATGAQQGARGIAAVTSGMQFDPPGVLLDGPVVSDHRADPAHDVKDPSIDLVAAGLRRNATANSAEFFHAMFDEISRQGRFEYATLIDADSDDKTGGSPSDLGLPTDAIGVELVELVRVDLSAGAGGIEPHLWRFDGSTFQEVGPTDLAADVLASVDGETGEIVGSAVNMAFPLELLGARVENVRLQAIARSLETEEVDRLPDSTRDLRPLVLLPPKYPGIKLDPPTVRPGGTVRVTVDGMRPRETVKIFIGDKMVSTPVLDGEGGGSFPVGIPADTVDGPRLITVGVAETALSADAIVFVESGGQDAAGLGQWSWLAVLVAVLLLLLIAAWFVVARRRRRA